MELPHDVIAVIRDFSRPCTRPDWRTLHRFTALEFHLALASHIHRSRVIYRLLINSDLDFMYKIHFFNMIPVVQSIKDLRTGFTYYVIPS